MEQFVGYRGMGYKSEQSLRISPKAEWRARVRRYWKGRV
jgi:hypothetical protein